MAKNLTRTDAVASGDLFVLYKTSAGDYRGAPADVIVAYMQDQLTFPSFEGQASFLTQYAVPSSTGFNVTVGNSNPGKNIHLILTPTAGFAAGTITLPIANSSIDKQEVLVNCTQQVTTLTVALNGAVAVTGAPASLAADDFFRLKFDLQTQTWYRVG